MRRTARYRFRVATAALAWALAMFGSLSIGVQPAAAFEIAAGEPFTYRNGKLAMSGTSAQFAARVSDETGTGPLVFGTGPTLDAPTITGDATLPNDFIGAMSEIASALRSGPDGTKLATIQGTIAEGHVAVADANGDLVDGGAPGGSGVSAPLAFASQGDIAFADAGSSVYIGAGTGVSTTEARVRTPTNGGTFGRLVCYAAGSVGGSGAVVTVGSGACTGALTYPASNAVEVTVTGTTSVSDTTDTIVVAAGECIALRVTWTDTTTDQPVNCTLEKVA